MTSMSFKGITAASMGVVVMEYPPLIKPAARVELVKIPGRSGTLTLQGPETVYEPVEKVCRCRLLDTASQAAVSAWLDGSGALVFGNEPAYKYTARVGDEIYFSKIMPGYDDREFSIIFVCQPWKELATAPADQTITSTGTTVNNAGTLDALPVLLVTGSGDVTVLVGSLYSFSLTGMSAGTPLRLDCSAGIVTDEDVLVNYTNKMSGQFPRLTPGNSTVSWTGSVTSIVVTKNQRWL